MPIVIQDKGSGLYVTEIGGFALNDSEAATFDTEAKAWEHRQATMLWLGEMQKHWDLRVVIGPDEEK